MKDSIQVYIEDDDPRMELARPKPHDSVYNLLLQLCLVDDDLRPTHRILFGSRKVKTTRWLEEDEELQSLPINEVTEFVAIPLYRDFLVHLPGDKEEKIKLPTSTPISQIIAMLCDEYSLPASFAWAFFFEDKRGFSLIDSNQTFGELQDFEEDEIYLYVFMFHHQILDRFPSISYHLLMSARALINRGLFTLSKEPVNYIWYSSPRDEYRAPKSVSGELKELSQIKGFGMLKFLVSMVRMTSAQMFTKEKEIFLSLSYNSLQVRFPKDNELVMELATDHLVFYKTGESTIKLELDNGEEWYLSGRDVFELAFYIEELFKARKSPLIMYSADFFKPTPRRIRTYAIPTYTLMNEKDSESKMKFLFERYKEAIEVNPFSKESVMKHMELASLASELSENIQGSTFARGFLDSLDEEPYTMASVTKMERFFVESSKTKKEEFVKPDIEITKTIQKKPILQRMEKSIEKISASVRERKVNEDAVEQLKGLLPQIKTLYSEGEKELEYVIEAFGELGSDSFELQNVGMTLLSFQSALMKTIEKVKEREKPEELNTRKKIKLTSPTLIKHKEMKEVLMSSPKKERKDLTSKFNQLQRTLTESTGLLSQTTAEVGIKMA